MNLNKNVNNFEIIIKHIILQLLSEFKLSLYVPKYF